MAKVNVKVPTAPILTHEGGKSDKISNDKQLRRTVMTCLLWEDSFYEDGVSVADRIKDLVSKVHPIIVASIALEARNQMYLRHVPLLLVRELARHKGNGPLVAELLPDVIQRADELAEFLAIYWKDGKCPISNGVKKGLAAAFQKFSAFDLAKYNRDSAIKLRDVLFLSHAKPLNREQAETWKKLIDGKLPVPETWETMLSAGKDKKATFEYLINEGKLGGLAFLRNLRNMKEAGVAKNVVAKRLEGNFNKVLPFRFVTAARIVPQWEDIIEPAMLNAAAGMDKLPGSTGILIDVSGSMDAPLSAKGETTRIDAAAGLAILVRELCSTVSIAGYSEKAYHVKPRRGFALADAFRKMYHGGTDTSGVLNELRRNDDWFGLDRMIVITDEQHCFGEIPQAWAKNSYIINVATYKNGTGYKNGWNHIDGWSENVIRYIQEIEKDSQ
jgi:60 kDa SS-A/Ro ribonucleoprotein